MRRALGLAALAVLAGCHEQHEENSAVPGPGAVASAAIRAEAVIASRGAEQQQEQGAAAACHAHESTIFTCKLKDGKRVSVCGASEWLGYYRYGGSSSEIEVAGAKYASVMYSGGGEAQIAFDNGDTRYIVFSRMVRTGFDDEGNKPAISDGIVIDRGGKFLDLKTCDDPDLLPVQNEAANVIWENEGELFTDETIRADPFGNE